MTTFYGASECCDDLKTNLPVGTQSRVDLATVLGMVLAYACIYFDCQFKSGRIVKLTARLHLVLRIRMHGAILHCFPVW
jgi:hypothetical protein